MTLTTALNTTGDWKPILIVSALVGALAGLVSELIVARGTAGDTGGFEWPAERGSGRRKWYDLGSFAAIPVGMLAAVIAGLALTPTQEVVKNKVTSEEMKLEDLLVVAAIAGLSGSAFLRLLQERFIAVAKNQTLDSALKGALRSFDELAKKPQTTPPTPTNAAEDVKRADNDQTAEQVATRITEQAAETVATDLAARADQAKSTLMATAGDALEQP